MGLQAEPLSKGCTRRGASPGAEIGSDYIPKYEAREDLDCGFLEQCD